MNIRGPVNIQHREGFYIPQRFQKKRFVRESVVSKIIQNNLVL